MAYADELQAVSVDEALIDVTSQVHALATAPPEMDVTTKTARDAGEALEEAETSAEKVDSPEHHADTPDLARQEAHIAAMAESASHATNGGPEQPEEIHQSMDWAKVLAERIRSDVRKATRCEGKLSPEGLNNTT